MISYHASMIITEKGIKKDAYLIVENGKITGIRERPVDREKVISFKNCIISPGYIDIHTHGALGYEPGAGSVEGLLKWSNFELEQGVTGFLPSTPSVSLKQLKKAARDIRKVKSRPYSNILGMQMEGPFYRKGEKVGAQNPEYIQEQFPLTYRNFIEEYRDTICYLALDPSLDCSPEITDFCLERGIKLSAAHSSILYEEFLEHKESYSCITHTFNGMTGLHHRKPGLAYAGCMDQDLFAEIICDGFHVSYPMLKLFFNLKGYAKPILITDAMLAVGMPPGSSYTLGQIKVTVHKEGKVVKDDGGLASSTLTMDKAVRNIVQELDIPLEKAVHMASLNPAKMLDIDDKKGSIAVGKDADFIILDSQLNVRYTYIRGKNLYKS